MSRAQLTSTVEQNTGGAVSPYVAGKNIIANGGFDIWQRGTTISGSFSGTTYTTDRFWALTGNAGASWSISRQATSDTTNLPNIQYCSRVQRVASNTNTTAINFAQDIETVNSVPFAGKTVTISFYARAGANFSSASNALTFQVRSGTGTDQSMSSGYTGSSSFINSTATLTTTWQRFTASATVSTSATQLGFITFYTPVGTAGANDYFEVTGVQLEVGSVATPFSRAGGTLQGELSLCQRYYYRVTNPNSSSDAMMPPGLALATTQCNNWIAAPVSMRVTPTSLDYNGIRAFDGVNVFTTTLSLASGSEKLIGVAAVTTGLTQFRSYYLIASTGANNSYIGWSAEL